MTPSLPAEKAPDRLLVVDDDPVVRNVLLRALEAPGRELESAADAEEAREALRASRFDLVVTDLHMPGDMDGIGLCRWVRENAPDADVLIVSAMPTLESALDAFRLGAVDFLLKPLDLQVVGLTVARCLERRLIAWERELSRKALRQRDEELRQSQKMEAVGRLAGGVAHDFNNLLMVIQGYSDILGVSLGASSPLLPEVEEIRKASRRAAALTRQLLAFSRRQVLQPAVLNLNDVVADISRMLNRLIGEDIELAPRLQPGLWNVKADRCQLDQVIMNLAVNARDAMPGGGRLTIETSNVPAGNGGPAQVLLAMKDTGVGMDAETLSHIFEPFFTTKEKGKGTGLGLSMVHGVVHQSGGRIEAESAPDAGTTFRIRLPAADAAAEGEGQAETVASRRGSETVLLVEDEDALLQLTRRTLAASGYRVLEARHGEEALRVAGEYRDPIDLLVTDMVMPNMNGRELAAKLTERRPGIRVILVSGYSEEFAGGRRPQPGTVFIEKPFSAETLLHRVRETLERDEARA